MRNHAGERLKSVEEIGKQLDFLDRHGLWKPTSISDQATIEDQKDEILRILNVIETELEKAGLWDRSIDTNDKDADNAPSVTLEQIALRAREARNALTPKYNSK